MIDRLQLYSRRQLELLIDSTILLGLRLLSFKHECQLFE